MNESINFILFDCGELWFQDVWQPCEQNVDVFWETRNKKLKFETEKLNKSMISWRIFPMIPSSDSL